MNPAAVPHPSYVSRTDRRRILKALKRRVSWPGSWSKLAGVMPKKIRRALTVEGYTPEQINRFMGVEPEKEEDNEA